MPDLQAEARAGRVRSGDVELAVYEWGDAAGVPLLFVHGYPDCSRVWHGVIAQLRDRYHCIAYDVRGAGQSTVPAGRSAWALDLLADDLEAVMEAVDRHRRVHLIGHDWGSIQAWEAVTSPHLQGRIASFTSVSGPCLDHIGKLLHKHLRQGDADGYRRLLRQLGQSWYVLLFQLPLLGPLAWRLGLDRLWPLLLARLEQLEAVEPSPSQRQDGRYGVNLYRANVLRALLSPRERSTRRPVQLILPQADPFVGADLYEDIERWVSQLWRREPDGGHWLPLTHPLQLASQVREFVEYLESGIESPALQAARQQR